MANFFGSNGDDSLTGSGGSDNFFVFGGSDVVSAGDGDDLILVDPGNGSSSSSADILDGGTGFDTVVLSGAMADYATTFNLAGFLVLTGKPGTAVEGNSETLIDIEAVAFDDHVLRIVNANGGPGSLTTIQSAVDLSASGDSVAVLAGTYSEAVSVTKALSFVGAGAANVTVSGAGNGFHVTGDIDNGGTESVSIDGFTVSANNVGVNVSSTTNLSELVISNSVFSGNSTFAIGSGSGAPDLDSVSITNSTFSNNGTGGSNGSGHIVLFGYTGDANISDITITSLGAFGDPVAGLPDNAIQISGFDPTTYDVENPLGTVSLQNITITGAFHKPPLTIQGYNNLTTLSLGNIDITGSSTWGPLVYIDPIATAGTGVLGTPGNPGSFVGAGGTNTIDLSGVTLTNLGTSEIDAYVRGTDADDIIIGTASNDFLNDVAESFVDYGGDDSISAGAGDDILVGGIGNDTLDGGTGNDTVLVYGNRDDYTITQNNDGTYTVTQNALPAGEVAGPLLNGGTDSLTGVEQIVFRSGLGPDTTVELSANAPDYSGALQRYAQSFEDDASSDAFFDGGYGVATIKASGTDGITSTDGSNYAVFEEDGLGQAPFTRFDGYRNNLDGGFTTSFDVYLDSSKITAGEGFDVSVAGNSQAGVHFRDFILHVTHDTSSGKILIGGSNNTNFDPREDLETQNHAEATTAGWYTFEWQFYENTDGDVEVAMNVYDGLGNWIFTEVRATPADDFDTVYGGNRYLWFTNIDVAEGIAVDNFSMSTLDTSPVQLRDDNLIIDSFDTIAEAITAAGLVVPVGALSITLASGDYSAEGTVAVDVEGLIIGGPADATGVSLSLAAGISNIQLSGDADIAVTGNALANGIVGNDGDNTLSGGEGNDTLTGSGGNDELNGGLGQDWMVGGAGDDTYFVDDFFDVITENVGEGTDTVLTSMNLYVLDENVENGTYNGTETFHLIGNSLGNVLTTTDLAGTGGRLIGRGGDDLILGGAGKDILSGQGGIDTLDGGEGNDRYIYSGNDIINDTGTSKWDQVNSFFHDLDLSEFSGVENGKLNGFVDLDISGDASVNRLIGNFGDNMISGGGGGDILTGRGGDDVFVFSDTSDSTQSDQDLIKDFEQGVVGNPGDLISLFDIDAIDGGRNNAFTFVGTNAFSNQAGELRYFQTATQTVVEGDTDGDGNADISILLTGNFALEDADFIL